jgi:hypothetical protein
MAPAEGGGEELLEPPADAFWGGGGFSFVVGCAAGSASYVSDGREFG